MNFTIEIPDQVVNEEPELNDFLKALQLMVNRMAVSHFKYGNMSTKYPESASGIGLMKQRGEKYEQTGNVDYALDAANGAVIEFLFPGHPKAHHEARETRCVSPGLAWRE